jgi:ligand-binding SRPBCC domain-containing protein
MAETTFKLRVWTRYFTSVEEVWAHKTTPAHLLAELPYWARPALSAKDIDTLREAILHNRPAEVSARVGLLKLSWPIRLVHSAPPLLFEDHSENRMFSRFEHRHQLEEAPDGCRYIDQVTFTPRGPSAKLSALSLKWVFERRHRVAARHLPADQRTIGTAVLRVLIEEDDD